MGMQEAGGRGRRSRRGSGKAGRSGEAGQNPHLEVPFIPRRIKPYEIMNEAQLDQIEATSNR